MKRGLVNVWVLSDALVMLIREVSVVAPRLSSGYSPAQGSLQCSVQGTKIYPAWFALVNSKAFSLYCVKYKQNIHLDCIFYSTSMLISPKS